MVDDACPRFGQSVEVTVHYLVIKKLKTESENEIANCIRISCEYEVSLDQSWNGCVDYHR
jgi:hypothetical protein